MKKNRINFKNTKCINKLRKVKSKNVFKIVVALSLCWSAVFVFLNRNNVLNPDLTIAWLKDKFTFTERGNGFPLEIKGEKVSSQNFKLMDENILLVSNTNYMCFKKNSDIIKTMAHSFYNPVLKTCEDKVIIYDLNGKELQVGFKSNVIDNFKTEKKILSAAVSGNGVFAVCCLTASGSTELEVFKVLKKEPILEMKFNEEYLNDVVLSTDGNTVTTIANTLKDGKISSVLKVIDVKNKKEKYNLESKENLMFFLEYVSLNNVLAIGDRSLAVVNTTNGKQKEYNFSEKKLLAFDVLKDNGFAIALSVSDSGNNSEILIFNKKGDLKKTIKTDLKVTALSYNYGTIAALSDGCVFFYDSNGKNTGKVDCGKEAKNIKLLSNKKVFVLNPRQVLLKSSD